MSLVAYSRALHISFVSRSEPSRPFRAQTTPPASLRQKPPEFAHDGQAVTSARDQLQTEAAGLLKAHRPHLRHTQATQQQRCPQGSHPRIRIPTHHTLLLQRGFRRLDLFLRLLVWVPALGCRVHQYSDHPLRVDMHIPARSVVCLWLRGVLAPDRHHFPFLPIRRLLCRRCHLHLVHERVYLRLLQVKRMTEDGFTPSMVLV